MRLSPFRIFIVSFTFLSACSKADVQTESVGKLKLEAEQQSESWGAPEHTHADFVSVMASSECPKEEDGVKYIDPLPKLIELARERNVVMINEAHYKPIHRAFIGELAKGLKTVGYDFYGAETFAVSQFSKNNRNSELSSRGYPILSDGVYTEEPIFGQLIETLIDNEYQLFSYESTTPLPPEARSNITHRDSEQARNIISEIGNSRDKKILIHAGYDHVRENQHNRSEKWMAQYFKEQSGIDPLTISQTDCYSASAYDSGILGYAMPVNKEGKPLSFAAYDVLLIPPKEVQYKERPIWLKEVSGRNFVDVPQELKLDDQYTRIIAYDLGKVKDAVVEDTIYRAPHSDKSLALRPGTYRLEVTDKNKTLLVQGQLSVQ